MTRGNPSHKRFSYIGVRVLRREKSKGSEPMGA